MTKSKIFSIVCFVLLIATSVIIGLRQGPVEPYVGTVPSDVVSYNTLLDGKFQTGDIYANGVHSFLLKYPIIVIENMFGASEAVLTVFAVLLMATMTVGIAYLIWRFSGRNHIVTALGMLALSNILLLTNVNHYFMALSWVTVRNIEIPLTILFMVWLVGADRIKNWQRLVATVGLALIFISDRLTMSFVIASVAMYLVSVFMRSRKKWLKKYNDIVRLLAFAIIISLGLEMILNQTGLIKFAYTYPSSISLISSFGQLLRNLADLVISLAYVFGADIWNADWWQWPLYMINIAIIVGFVVLSIVTLLRYKNQKKSKELWGDDATILLIAFSIVSIGFYVLLDHIQGFGVDARFLIYLMPIAILLAARYARDWQPDLRTGISITMVVLLSVVGAGSVVTMQMIHDKENIDVKSVRHAYELVSGILDDENITVLVGGYPYLHTIKWFYDQNHDGRLDIAVMAANQCNIADSKSSRRSWFLSNDETTRVALIDLLLPCSKEIIRAYYGTPAKQYIINNQDGQAEIIVYIYDHDIRKLLDMRNFK